MKKNKRIIGFDLDDTLTCSINNLASINQVLNTNYKLADMRDYDTIYAGDTDRDGRDDFWDLVMPTFVKQAKVSERSLKMLMQLLPGYDEVVIITAREERYKEDTLEWLKNAGLPFEPTQVILTSGYDKMKAIRDTGCNTFVEDRMETLDKVHQEFPFVETVLVQQPWNEDLDSSLVGYIVDWDGTVHSNYNKGKTVIDMLKNSKSDDLKLKRIV